MHPELLFRDKHAAYAGSKSRYNIVVRQEYLLLYRYAYRYDCTSFYSKVLLFIQQL